MLDLQFSYHQSTMAAKESIELPILDVSQPGPETAKDLIEAVRNYGFVFIKNNHSEIPVADVDEMFALVSLHRFDRHQRQSTLPSRFLCAEVKGRLDTPDVSSLGQISITLNETQSLRHLGKLSANNHSQESSSHPRLTSKLHSR